jgi:glutathionylspermidine synthase
LNLNHAKWDTHVGDGRVLSAEPLLIREDEWRLLCALAETAAQELVAAEREIALKKDIQKLIGLPRRLQNLLQDVESGSDIRTFRFDFHPTATGWVISEVNSDVPGGFGEASFLPSLYEEFTDATPLPRVPLDLWGEVMQSHLSGGTIAFLYAPGFLEDEQVVRVLARELRERGFNTRLIQSPFALKWNNSCAVFRSDRTKVDGVVRFYQAEWLSQLPSWSGWKNLFGLTYGTHVVNPTISAISESKRLRLCLHCVSTRTDTFQLLLPECREPSDIVGLPKDDWVLKATYSNTGDDVHLGTDISSSDWSGLLAKASRQREGWVAQRRFETLSLPSIAGSLKPCVGVFVIGGQATGAYVRLSRTQLTNGYALEAPLFIMKPKEHQ